MQFTEGLDENLGEENYVYLENYFENDDSFAGIKFTDGLDENLGQENQKILEINSENDDSCRMYFTAGPNKNLG